MTYPPGSRPSATLLLRLRSAPDGADTYTVDATLDGEGSLTAQAVFPPDVFDGVQADPWEYGCRLGNALFADAALRRAFAYARGLSPRVSLCLQVDAAALQDLHWERLILVDAGQEMVLATDARVSLSRRIPSVTPALPPRGGAFTVLLAIASPTDLVPDGPLHPVDVAAEIAALRDAWTPLVERGQLRAAVLGRIDATLAASLRDDGYAVAARATTLSAISDHLDTADSLHLIAHGTFKNDRATLLLENEEGGALAVAEEAFLSRIGHDTRRLVSLLACKGAARRRGAPTAMSGLAPKLAGRAAGVVAMQDYVRMEDARRFAQAFYDTLLRSGNADDAANAGRRAIYRPDSGNWAIPAIYLGPKATALWQSDPVIEAVQALARKFRERADAKHPFPVEVIRHRPGVSPRTETSPPGPRVRVRDAVDAVLFPAEDRGHGIVVIAGNHGRAKTAQLRALYVHHAGAVLRGGTRLPFYLHLSTIPGSEGPPDDVLARAIVATARDLDIAIDDEEVRPRLLQSCLLLVDGDQESDTLQRTRALEALRRLTLANSETRVVVTLDEQAVGAATDTLAGGTREDVPVLLVQLLSPATVAQYLTSLGDDRSELLRAIQDANLFDLAGVPWLLAHLLRQPSRGPICRSGVISRVVEGNLAAANLSGISRRLVSDLLGRVAWTLQQRLSTRLDGQRLYELLDQVRGRRELPLEQLKAQALATQLIAPSHEDGVRFSYPGFQSYWCAHYLLRTGSAFPQHLDDITATLGRRSRVHLWEDTLALLAGMTDDADLLIRAILAGGSMSHGEQAFLAARCISEARLARRTVHDITIAQVLHSLVWRSTPMKESRGSVRIRATECLALLKQPESIPHLMSLAVERVRPTARGSAEFELSGLRHAALQVLLTMQDEVEQHLSTQRAGEPGAPKWTALTTLIGHWRAGDDGALRRFYDDTDVDGVRAIVAFALGTLGGAANLAFLAQRILDPEAADDTRWSLTDALLLFDPVTVTAQAIAPMRAEPSLHAHAAYMVGRLRVTTEQTEEWRFLERCLQADDARTRGVALRALAQLGAGQYRVLCEDIAKGAWREVARDRRLVAPVTSDQRLALRRYALQSLRLIGTNESIEALRQARAARRGVAGADKHTSHLDQLSYEVSEDIYWRQTGGFDGDLADPSDAAPLLR